MTEQLFFLSTRYSDGEEVYYASDNYNFTELDIINLIRLLVVDRRNRNLGNKILAVYRNATEHKKEETENTLKKLGIDDEPKPEKIPRNGKRR
jgi:hypothetical protein